MLLVEDSFLKALLSLVFGFLIGTPLSSIKADATRDFVATVLPSETVALVRAPDWKTLQQQAGDFPMGQIYNSELMRAFRGEIESNGGGYLIDTFGVDLSIVNQRIKGEFVIAIVPDQDQSISAVTLVELPDNTVAKQFVTSSSQSLIRRGITTTTLADGLPEDAKQFELKPRVGDPLSGGPLVLCAIDRFAVLCRSVDVFKTIKQRSQEKVVQDGLLKSNRYLNAMARFDANQPHLFEFYIDLIGWLTLSDQMEASQSGVVDDPSNPRVPFPLRHGFPGLKAIVGAGWQNPTTKMMEFEGHFVAPPPRDQAMQMFEFVGGDVTIPDYVPDDFKVTTIVRWKLAAVIDNLSALFDDITDAPGAFEATLEDLKRFLNVDLQGVLMPALGPQITLFSLYDTDLDLDTQIIAVSLADPSNNEINVARSIYQLLSGDTEAKRMRLPGKKYELWQVRLAVGRDSAFSSLGVIVDGGNLWISTHAPVLRRLLLQRNQKPMIEMPLHKAFRDVVDPLITDQTFGISLSRMDVDTREAYETLRTTGPSGLEDVESIYSSLLQLLIDEENSVIDFSTMPRFDDVKDDLHQLAVLADVMDHGWKIRGRVFRGEP